MRTPAAPASVSVLCASKASKVRRESGHLAVPPKHIRDGRKEDSALHFLFCKSAPGGAVIGRALWLSRQIKHGLHSALLDLRIVAVVLETEEEHVHDRHRQLRVRLHV